MRSWHHCQRHPQCSLPRWARRAWLEPLRRHESGKVICLANKESLVLAGDLVRRVCARTGAVVLPVDSEHNAIFQCLAGRGQEVERLILTLRAGPSAAGAARP